MAVADPPSRTIEQRRTALVRANQVRLANAARKQAVKAARGSQALDLVRRRRDG